LLDALSRAQHLGFLGPGPVEEHLTHAQGFAIVDEPRSALDLGSGAGVPGLVLAARWPDSAWVLLDGQARRGAFLVDAVGRLGLTHRVQVVVERAERAAHRSDLRGSFDLVVARSFGPPAVTAECAAGFLRTGGHLVVSEPPDDDAARWPAAALAKLGLHDEGRRGNVRLVTCVDTPDPSVPRREGVPGKHPRW